MATEIKRDENGAERCMHVVDGVVANDPKNPSAGYRKAKVYCNKPITFSVSEGRKVCPECDKQAPVGWVNPRITNAAGVALAIGELKELGLTEDPTLVAKAPVKAPRKPRVEKPAVEAKVKKEIKKDVVTLEVPLALLEANDDVAAALIRQTMDAFGKLPVTNYAESKRLMLLEEKLKRLLEA